MDGSLWLGLGRRTSRDQGDRVASALADEVAKQERAIGVMYPKMCDSLWSPSGVEHEF